MIRMGKIREPFNQYVPPFLLGGFYLATLSILSEHSWVPLQTMQTPVLIATGLIIIWYTWETRRLGNETKQLSKEAKRQTELQLRPLIILRCTAEGFEVSNVGNGTALNVSINDIIISKIEEVRVRFPEPVPVIRSGESMPIFAESLKQGQIQNPPNVFFAHLNPTYANRSFEFAISFEDIESRSFCAKQSIGPKKISIIGISSRSIDN